jgi:RNA polymerase sigma-70 factor (ECF subfamily)
MQDSSHCEPSDVDLMSLVQQGRRPAFTRLVHRYQQPLLNFFRRMGVYNDAEDLVQETFVRLFKYRLRYESKGKFSTFLYMMARQIWIDYLRKRTRRQDLAQDLHERDIDAASSRRKDEETRSAVREAIEALPERMRMVVVMSVYQGLKYGEIAAILEVPEGTVKSRMFHALRKLRGLLDAGAARN